ncbi:hypothetical protein KIW84_010972 [Lathyrus oleraceus]|uniref:TF-B3 domain-containing protein n=1 Tax=Pisum sativum TaxID=3888 RepID=A0A9D5BAF5_PEA|nr:hypothetical protein KIW84_010972 [Pisum sativum]
MKIIGKNAEEVNQPSNEVQAQELFPEINIPQEHGPDEHVNDDVQELAVDLFWEKKVTRAMKGKRNVLHFPIEVIRRRLRVDQTQCTLMDLDTMDYYECEIIKSDREQVDMYMGYGWYEYAKYVNLKVGDVLLYHYHSPS